MTAKTNQCPACGKVSKARWQFSSWECTNNWCDVSFFRDRYYPSLIEKTKGDGKILHPAQMITLGALDSLAVALADHGHRWTEGERAIYEQAVDDAIERLKSKRKGRGRK